MGIVIRRIADVIAMLTVMAVAFTAVELLIITFVAIACDESVVMTVPMLMRFVIANYLLAGLIAILSKFGLLHK